MRTGISKQTDSVNHAVEQSVLDNSHDVVRRLSGRPLADYDKDTTTEEKHLARVY